MDYISSKEAALKVKRWPKNTIAAGRRHSVGLKSDGTVTAVGDNQYGQCNVSGWRGIVAIAVGVVIPSALNRTVLWRLWAGMSMVNAI